MKQLILIAAMLMSMTAKLVAQENKSIEVNHFQKQNIKLQKENHQFEIVAKEDVDVNLKFKLKEEGYLNVLVTDKKDKVVFSKKIQKESENRIAFTMEENEKYTIKLIGDNQSNLVVNVSED
ncbi:hypothetical protein [Flavobacterium sangjuense]|uniref:Uncharacterized protein n=1 Tax=Flavobacterium sangjuense TaxID=2518177 RepID=A0A4P7PVY9_9FLAO|nr:hypothetical protein [Flavobacterium sangjuense]QBZ98560.1 hypothetical protein GS03_02068 [Flavobacterium sangjuense]